MSVTLADLAYLTSVIVILAAGIGEAVLSKRTWRRFLTSGRIQYHVAAYWGAMKAFPVVLLLVSPGLDSWSFLVTSWVLLSPGIYAWGLVSIRIRDREKLHY